MDCKWCGVQFDDAKALLDHEKIHEDLDFLNGVPPKKKRKIESHPHEDNSLHCSSVPHSPVPGPSHAPDVQYGGGEKDTLSYEVRPVSERTFKNRVIDRHYRVTFYPSTNAKRLTALHEELHNMFDDVISSATRGLQESDLGRVIIHHDALTNPVYVPLRPLRDLTAARVMEYLQNVLNSHENLPMNQSFRLDLGTMELPKGGKGKKITSLTGPNSALHTKQSVIEINNADTTCLARAIVVGFLAAKRLTTAEWREMTTGESGQSTEEKVLIHKKCPAWYFKEVVRRENRQKSLVLEVCRRAGVPTDRLLSTTDIPALETLLQVDVLVICARSGNAFIRVPPEGSCKKRVYLYWVKQESTEHFHAIVNICGFFGQSKFCTRCLKPHENKHRCDVCCLVCKHDDCILSEEVHCDQCHMTCRSQECYERHKASVNGRASQCQTYWKCPTCKKVLNTGKRKPEHHFCGEWLCKCCTRYVERDHLCYVTALEPEKPKTKFVFFDFECTQENDVITCKEGYAMTRDPECTSCKDWKSPCNACATCTNCQRSCCGKYRHEPNLVIAHTVCGECMNQDELTPVSKCESCGSRCPACNKFNKKDKCYETPPCNETCGFREVIFKGRTTKRDFGKWLFDEKHKGFTVMAHNMKGYDGYFLLDYLIDQSIRPDKIIYAGSKIMYMHVNRTLNIRILDSLNYLPMALSKLPEAFGLNELKKGYFPHHFNKGDNQNYVGPYPDTHYYVCDAMSDGARERFLTWHESKMNAAEVFDFQKEIVEYCRSDVDILRKACLKFRQLLLDVTGRPEITLNEETGEWVESLDGAVDPFCDITIASVCTRIFRTKFLCETVEVKTRRGDQISDWLPGKQKAGQLKVFLEGIWMNRKELQQRDYFIEIVRFVSSPISQIPSYGYTSRDTFSFKSLRWLSWISERNRLDGTPIEIRHALNGGEVSLPNTKYRFDGYQHDTATAYEFLGCYWHGCRECFPDRQLKLLRTGESMEELFALTKKKQRYIESQGMKYVCIWEHDFDRLLTENPTIQNYVSSLDLQPRLKPRDAFFGGRTNAAKLFYEVKQGERSNYVDFTSLYPYVNKYERYPVKEPTIVTSDFKNIREYFGMAKIKVLPPRGLYHPVLPMRINDKLTFCLCHTCAVNGAQKPCSCDDEHRALTGTWCTPELTTAMDEGYKIIKIYEVYHWNEWTQYDRNTGKGGLFAEYINLFLKFKQESSDWPTWVKTKADTEKYVQQYLEKEGVRLDENNIKKNKALRSLAKLMLNSFWGKFGQNIDKPQNAFYHETEGDKFFQIVSDANKTVKDFNIVSDDTIHLCWESREKNTVPENLQTNVFIAAFTTCHARLRLYGVLKHLQERVLYYDTDSVIYVSRPGDSDPETGDYLGELTNELQDGDYIVKFVSGGPKQYGYETFRGHQECKIRGFSLNYENKKLLNFELLLDLVKTSRKSEPITLVNDRKISRDKHQQKIYNRREEKKYSIVYNKRVIQQGSFDTLPYGF